MQRVVFQGRLHDTWRRRFTVSHLSYTVHTRLQCQAAVKVPGSFRPVARSEHLYSHCNFAESMVETVPESLRHSCRSELHVRSPVTSGTDYAFILFEPWMVRQNAVGRSRRLIS